MMHTFSALLVGCGSHACHNKLMDSLFEMCSGYSQKFNTKLFVRRIRLYFPVSRNLSLILGKRIATFAVWIDIFVPSEYVDRQENKRVPLFILSQTCNDTSTSWNLRIRDQNYGVVKKFRCGSGIWIGLVLKRKNLSQFMQQLEFIERMRKRSDLLQ